MAHDPRPARLAPPPARGRRPIPDAVWDAVRADYLAGLSAPECCRRHGVGLSALRDRAAREGWRRIDQGWTPPDRLDPWDEGVELETRVDGNLDRVEMYELSYVAHRRMMRAVMRGDAAAALRWRRVRAVMDDEQARVEREIERQEAMEWHRANIAFSDASDASDGVFADGVFADGVSTAPPPAGAPS